MDDRDTERPHFSLGYATPAAFAAGLEQQQAGLIPPVASPALLRDDTGQPPVAAGWKTGGTSLALTPTDAPARFGTLTPIAELFCVGQHNRKHRNRAVEPASLLSHGIAPTQDIIRREPIDQNVAEDRQ